MSASHEDVRMLLGAYVLGGLDEADLREVQDHLRTCPTCRDELVAVAMLPGLLRRRPQPEQEQPGNERVDAPERAGSGPPSAPPDLLPALLQQVDLERRRGRRRSRGRLAIAAVTVAALTAGAGAVLNRDDGPVPAPAVAFAAAAGSAASGQARLLTKPWGTAITVNLAGLPRSGRFVLRTTGRVGAHEQAAAWAATTNGAAHVVGATSISTSDVTQVAVVGSGGQVVAVATPGSLTP